MLVPVRRSWPVSIARDAVVLRILRGAILHDPEGCYTVGPTVPVKPHRVWGTDGHYGLHAHTCRADHSREMVRGPDDEDPIGQVARAFVVAVGSDAAMEACRHADARGSW